MNMNNEPPTDKMYTFIGARAVKSYELSPTQDSVSLDPHIPGNANS